MRRLLPPALLLAMAVPGAAGVAVPPPSAEIKATSSEAGDHATAARVSETGHRPAARVQGHADAAPARPAPTGQASAKAAQAMGEQAKRAEAKPAEAGGHGPTPHAAATEAGRRPAARVPDHADTAPTRSTSAGQASAKPARSHPEEAGAAAAEPAGTRTAGTKAVGTKAAGTQAAEAGGHAPGPHAAMPEAGHRPATRTPSHGEATPAGQAPAKAARSKPEATRPAASEPAAGEPAGTKPAEGRSADAEIEALARQAMASSDPAVQAGILKRLREHHFKSSRAPERESALFVQGLLEDRQGNQAQAAAALHRLEQAFPRSGYLPEANVILADAALGRRRLQEAESRLRKALGAEMPGESRRRGQELYLWCLAEQGRSREGAAVLQAMGPQEDGQPNERGLVGIMMAQCATQDREGAAATLKLYHQKFPRGGYGPRLDLAWGKLLGTAGAAREAAVAFRGLVQSAPASPEADEARLALATLLTDGRLPAAETTGFPSAQSLLAGLKGGALKESQAREALLVKIRLAMGERKWPEAIGTIGQLRGQHPLPQELDQARELRAGALRQWTKEQVDRRQGAPLLPYLDREGVPSLTPELRLALTGCLARNGLPEAAQGIVPLAPPGERAALVKAALEGTTSAGNPLGTLDLLPGKGETARESLLRAQAQLALRKWPEARTALARAQAGPERIQALVAYLNRPAASGETLATRRREVDAWLARAPEKGPDREPLTILAADLRVREADWKGALALYPAAPQAANRGWVALMRATCQARLGQKEPARATLKAAAGDAGFQAERKALEHRLAM